MGKLCNELKDIIDKSLFSFPGNISGKYFLVCYGSDKFIVSINKLLLEICNTEEELSIEELLSLCKKFHSISIPDLIGQIQIIDSTHNKLCGFSIKNSTVESLLFNRRFYANLRMIDCGLPALLSNIVAIVNTGRINNVSDILNRLIILNPLHIADDWIENTYRFKLGRLLYNIVLGMNEHSVWKGLVPKGGLVYHDGIDFISICYYDQQSIVDFLMASSALTIEGLFCCLKIE